MGVREYRPEDPLKHIDWKSSARARQLQTRIFEPAVSMNVVVAMNGSTSDQVWLGTNRRQFERAITATASAIVLADRLGYSYGLISNAVASYSGKWLSVPVGASSFQLSMTLEALAMAAPYVISTLPEVFRAERDSFPAGTTVWFVTPVFSESLPGQLAVIADRGYRVYVLYAGFGEPPEKIGEFPVIGMGHLLDLLPEDETGWEGEVIFASEEMDEAGVAP